MAAVRRSAGLSMDASPTAPTLLTLDEVSSPSSLTRQAATLGADTAEQQPGVAGGTASAAAAAGVAAAAVAAGHKTFRSKYSVPEELEGQQQGVTHSPPKDKGFWWFSSAPAAAAGMPDDDPSGAVLPDSTSSTNRSAVLPGVASSTSRGLCPTLCVSSGATASVDEGRKQPDKPGRKKRYAGAAAGLAVGAVAAAADAAEISSPRGDVVLDEPAGLLHSDDGSPASSWWLGGLRDNKEAACKPGALSRMCAPCVPCGKPGQHMTLSVDEHGEAGTSATSQHLGRSDLSGSGDLAASPGTPASSSWMSKVWSGMGLLGGRQAAAAAGSRSPARVLSLDGSSLDEDSNHHRVAGAALAAAAAAAAGAAGAGMHGRWQSMKGDVVSREPPCYMLSQFHSAMDVHWLAACRLGTHALSNNLCNSCPTGVATHSACRLHQLCVKQADHDDIHHDIHHTCVHGHCVLTTQPNHCAQCIINSWRRKTQAAYFVVYSTRFL